jgi:hypothetical protein
VSGVWSDEFSFSGGAVVSRELGFLVASQDALEERDVAHSAFFICDSGEWRASSAPVPWIVAAGCLLDTDPRPRLVVVGRWGESLIVDSLGVQQETSDGALRRNVEELGPLRSLAHVNGRLHVTGTNRQLYIQTGEAWEAVLVPGIETDDPDAPSFECVAGFTGAEAYVVGTEGEVWCLDAGLLRRIEVPTNANLNGIACASWGTTYICGSRGTLMAGREDQWAELETGGVFDDFWSICEFDGGIYISSLECLYRLDSGGQFAPVEIGADAVSTFGLLSACSDALWSIGAKDVIQLSGGQWQRIE